jgi:hydrogenase maturation protease
MADSWVIAIGNAGRGDDAAGLLVARHLRARRLGPAEIVESDGDAPELLDLLRRAPCALLVDAGRLDAAAGTIRRIDCAHEAIPAAQPASSHGFGLAQAIGLARALGALPPCCLLYVIAGECWEWGAPVSPAVAAAAEAAAAMICRDLAASRRPPRAPRPRSA